MEADQQMIGSDNETNTMTSALLSLSSQEQTADGAGNTETPSAESRSFVQNSLAEAQRSSPARTSARSRRGCATCRKRKVKCNEERPNCSHCRRLKLTCYYETPPPSVRRQSRPLSYETPLPSQNSAPWAVTGSSRPSIQSAIPTGQFEVNTSRAQSVGYDGGHPQSQYDASLDKSVRPGMSFNDPMSDQNLQIQDNLLGSATWELELLGEDSLWANLPILSNLMSVQESEQYANFAQYNTHPAAAISPNSNDTQQPGVIPYTPNASSTAEDPTQLGAFRALQSNVLIPTDEINLLRHFVDFAVPPILVGVEPRWNSARDALLRVSKSSPTVRHAICAFSALSLGDPSTDSTAPTQPSQFYFDLAMEEVRKILEEPSLSNVQSESHESILASIFFLSYVEVITSKAPKSSHHLLERAHTILSSKKPSKSTLYQQLQIWLKLLDAKVVSAGGEGIHLHTNPETRDLDALRDASTSSNSNEEPSMETIGPDISVLETEEILFNSFNRPAYNFYLQVLNFSGRIARLDKWHRSRGSVQDEFEVMLAADKIVRDLNALWTRRPAVIDLADKPDQLRQCLASNLAFRVEQHLRTYTANFYACFIHLQRVAYAHLRATAQVKTAVVKIVHLSRLLFEEGHVLPVSMLWPLMMAACEVEDEETQGWIIGNIENMKSKVGNATRTAQLVREIVKRQKSGQRADARTVMHEAFGAVFAII